MAKLYVTGLFDDFSELSLLLNRPNSVALGDLLGVDDQASFSNSSTYLTISGPDFSGGFFIPSDSSGNPLSQTDENYTPFSGTINAICCSVRDLSTGKIKSGFSLSGIAVS